jgi:low affinity Fe/Cu permease
MCVTLPRRSRFVYAYAAAPVHEGMLMAFYAFYVIAITILVLHFTGWLKRNNLEWIVLVLAVATFPAVIFLK